MATPGKEAHPSIPASQEGPKKSLLTGPWMELRCLWPHVMFWGEKVIGRSRASIHHHPASVGTVGTILRSVGPFSEEAWAPQTVPLRSILSPIHPVPETTRYPGNQ